jgi:hypothetical protein
MAFIVLFQWQITLKEKEKEKNNTKQKVKGFYMKREKVRTCRIFFSCLDVHKEKETAVSSPYLAIRWRERFNHNSRNKLLSFQKGRVLNSKLKNSQENYNNFPFLNTLILKVKNVTQQTPPQPFLGLSIPIKKALKQDL